MKARGASESTSTAKRARKYGRSCKELNGSRCHAFFAHPLRVQNPSFAKSDLLPHHRLLLDRHPPLVNRDSIRLFLINRRIGWLTGARVPFDVNVKSFYGQI
jgi:hypothetical protein